MRWQQLIASLLNHPKLPPMSAKHSIASKRTLIERLQRNAGMTFEEI